MAITYRQQTPQSLAAIALALVAAGCTTTPPSDIADTNCVARKPVPIVVGEQVYIIEGHCNAWSFGPTRAQRAQFERRGQL